MPDVRQADADYYQAISKAVAKAHAKAVLRKAAAYAKAKAAMPSPGPLPTAKVMRCVLERPEILAHVPVLTRALDARARPIADMPDPPPGFDGIAVRITHNRELARNAFAINTHVGRGLKRRREDPNANQYIHAGDIAEDATAFNVAISNALERYMDANGIPDV